MTIATYSDLSPRPAGLLSRLVAGLNMLVRSIGDARLAATHYDELSRMNDRELSDIGLRREDIARTVFERHLR